MCKGRKAQTQLETEMLTYICVTTLYVQSYCNLKNGKNSPSMVHFPFLSSFLSFLLCAAAFVLLRGLSCSGITEALRSALEIACTQTDGEKGNLPRASF